MPATLPRLDRLHIEVTNVCNFKCEFCPDAIMERKRGHMDLGLLERLLDEIAEGQLAKIVTFHLMGEPLIYPHIFEAIALAVERELELHLTTNGSTFAIRPDHVERLVASGIPKVTISLQTPDTETFTIRGAPPRLQPDRYFDGITQYVQTNLADQHSKTRVNIKFLDSTPHPFLVPHKPLKIVEGREHMQVELNRWADILFEGYPDPPDRQWMEQQIRQHKPGRWQVVELHPKLGLETFPLDSWGNVELGAAVIPAKFGTCNGASSQAGVLYDGTVVPCCKDYEGIIPLGTVVDRPLAEVLNDRPACALRQGFDRLQVTNPACQRCIGADTRQKAVARQLASIAYFKIYTPLMRRLQPGWGEV
ncbi:radical SAM/SPASM domain-containing protein [Synechococcus sp. PCC 7336]|uniref:radical SAM/SPASM domain-containing protein n=1 Tax=Synechococcus sp. PCC 7336 TaxID=195250 RepID=UPI0003449872|nr:radical SAM/SPASM domain-containing protein [Synechococcus sp. PCC 7336]